MNTPPSYPIPLSRLQCEFADGIDAATRAIYVAELEICDPKLLSHLVEKHYGIKIDVYNFSVADRNVALANVVRDAATKSGWLAGYEFLAEACPDCGMHSTLVEDGTCRPH